MPFRDAEQEFVEGMGRFGLEKAIAERALVIGWHGEGPRELVWEQLLKHLGFDPAQLPRRWNRSPEELAARDARLTGLPEKDDAIGLLVFLLVYAAPSGDFSKVRNAPDEVEPQWRAAAGCLAWADRIAGCLTSSGPVELRRRAVSILGEVGSPATVAVLLDVLEDLDEPVSVLVEAAGAMLEMAGKIAPALRALPRVTTVLAARAGSDYFDDEAPNLRRNAASALELLRAAP